jgi:hypothetical protein
MYTFLFSPIRGICPARQIFLDFIILIMSCEGYKLWNSSLCWFLQSFVTSSKVQISPSAPYSPTP